MTGAKVKKTAEQYEALKLALAGSERALAKAQVTYEQARASLEQSRAQLEGLGLDVSDPNQLDAQVFDLRARAVKAGQQLMAGIEQLEGDLDACEA